MTQTAANRTPPYSKRRRESSGLCTPPSRDRVPGKDSMQFTAVIRRQRSFDRGLHWGEADTLFNREGSFCRQPIQKLQNGRWIFSNWLCSDSGNQLAEDPTVFQISDDQGKTWRCVELPNSRGRVHANVVELSPGHLVAFLRSREADWVYRSESLDNGDTWTSPLPTPLPNNNSSISALKLQSGRIAIAYNPTQCPGNKPGMAVWPGLRCPVAVALSEDEGHTLPADPHDGIGRRVCRGGKPLQQPSV